MKQFDKFDKSNDCTNLKHTQRYAITFGEVAILHVGGKEIGTRRDKGFSVDDLRLIKDEFGKYGELLVLSDNLPENLKYEHEAAVLVIRNGANILLQDKYGKNKLFMEQQGSVVYDDKYWDNRRGKTLNKRARKNTVFGDTDVQHSDDYKQSTINGFGKLEYLNKIKTELPKFLGQNANNLNAEGNWYFEEKSGIGFQNN